MKATARFKVTEWNPVASDKPTAGPVLSRIEITKAFADGDLIGVSKGEGLFCGMTDPKLGAGYLVSERFEGVLGELKGSFVMHHGGMMGPETQPYTFGDIVPGSGTEELIGISGSIQIAKTEDGSHKLELEYTL